jgi:hypothetical protein
MRDPDARVRTGFVSSKGATAMPRESISIESRRFFASVTILLADDYPPWRSEVKAFLRRQTLWNIILWISTCPS